MQAVVLVVAVVAAALLCGLAPGANGAEPTIPRACVAPYDTFPFCNASLAYEVRIADLISRLTLDEKPLLLIARESPKGNISRLGIPEYDWGGNCIHGVQSRCAPDGRCPTSFPDPNTLGATFNASVWQGMGAAIGVELRSLWLQNVGEDHDGNLPHIGLDCWSPNVNIVRDPRWGRNLETPSEDPFICGEFGAYYTLGLQNGSDPRFYQAITTLKHFDANSLEGNWGPYGNITRHTVDSNISIYDLQSSYFPAFRRSIVKGGAMGVMCSYNSINGVPSCANKWLLDQLKEWGFKGYVTSDSGAVEDIYQSHHYTDNWIDTVSVAVSAGCDIESAPWPANQPWATDGPYLTYIPQAVAAGKLNESAVDLALTHALNIRFRLGLFDPIADQPYWNVPPTEVRKQAHLDLALDATDQGLVLLKNDARTLPLAKGKTLAVIGPHTNAQATLVGNYIGQICPSSISDYSCVESPLHALTRLNVDGVTLNATGCAVNTTDTSGFAAALAAAQKADQVVLMMGIDLSIEEEGRDRHDIRLPATQIELATQILALGKPTVLVLLHGGILALDDGGLDVSAPAIVSAGYPGFFGADSLARALFGDSNRWGKLAVTWYKSHFTEEKDMLDFNMVNRTYRYYHGEPSWTFGHGLSYTTFALSPSSSSGAPLAVSAVSPGNVSVVLTNTGPIAGDNVVFAFFRAAAGTIPLSAPAANIIQQVFGYERVNVPAGKSTKVTFAVTTDALTLFDSNGDEVLYTGEYEILLSDGVLDPIVIPVTVS